MAPHDNLPTSLNQPWLVAAWPGMGHVGILAATFLLEQLGAERIGEVQTESYYELNEVSVEQGLMLPPRRPRGVLYAWRDPEQRRDLVIFLSEAQPKTRGYELCEELVRVAKELGVTRITTFAAMASPLDPSAPSKVHTLATDAATLSRFTGQGAIRLEKGEISGLNGVLLVAGQAEGLPGSCLLGEFPYFAPSLPQPKAAAAILRVFCPALGLEVDLTALDKQAEFVEGRLTELLGELKSSAKAHLVAKPEDAAKPTPEPVATEPQEPSVDPAVIAHVEAKFAETEADRSKALELKALLDEHGLFKDYEDRFLDLFTRGE